jgi:flagellar biosynthesis protein FliQ
MIVIVCGCFPHNIHKQQQSTNIHKQQQSYVLVFVVLCMIVVVCGCWWMYSTMLRYTSAVINDTYYDTYTSLPKTLSRRVTCHDHNQPPARLNRDV